MPDVLITLRLVAHLAKLGEREAAVRELARQVGAEEMMFLVADPEIGALIPARGLSKTLPDALAWHTFTAATVESGRHQGMLMFPGRTAPLSALGRSRCDQAVVVFLGGEPDSEAVEQVLALLPLLVAAFQAEQSVLNALAISQLARNAAKQLRDQASAVEAARRVAHVEVIERRRAEVALAQKASELERSNSDLQQFAAIVAHDLQEPLRMVASYLGLLEIRYQAALDEKAHGYIQKSVDGTKRMSELIRSLLSYALVESEKANHTSTPLALAVQGALDNLTQRVATVGAEIHCDPLPSITGDKVLLTQLFQNLIGNALKFTSPGVPPVIRISMVELPEAWEIRVSDNGIGIPPQFHERIFGVFQRLHARDQYEGTGIGLATCRRIAALHRASITVQSQAGNGATFIVHFPRG